MSLRTRLGVSALAMAALIPMAGPAAAAPASPAAAVPGLQGHDASTASVTLITGDRAELTTGADGKTAVHLYTDEPYATRQDGDDLYVVPRSAARLIAAGRLDERLFNISGLVRQGYDDARTTKVPLIIQGAAALHRSAVATPLGSGAAAVQVEKKETGAFFAALTAARSQYKIWLDGKVAGFDLDPGTGVGQTGAEQAWAAGFDGNGTTVAVLDSGHDPEHPDLRGRLAGEQDFTGLGSAADENGHGTHVASTILGTGAADATRKGMAPGAKLLAGRVLNSGGYGQESWIIAGMEWAVAQGADVVNMSLGSSEITDCTDPLGATAQRLSRQTKTLFVVAAGNQGLRRTVSSPGCAEGVLTVGALDAEGKTAAFSSRGPASDAAHLIKPEIAAPGVEIVGAALGSVAGLHYTRMSGTSMAAPHVAGAAALLRQAHPDWSAQQLKAALISGVKSRAKDGVYAQGAGELSVPGALAATVQGPGTVSLGALAWPHPRGQRASKEIVYTNLGDRPVRLQLRIDDVAGKGGHRVPSRAFKLGAHQVVVPAHGTASVEVTGDAGVPVQDKAYGEIGARVLATGRGVSVTTAVGFWAEPEQVTLTVKATGRDGGAPEAPSYLDVIALDEVAAVRSYLDGTGEQSYTLPVGRYALSAFVYGGDTLSYLGDPELELSKDTTVVFDARTAQRITAATDRPSTVVAGTLQYGRWWDRYQIGGGAVAGQAEYYAAPTSRARTGGFELVEHLRATFDGGVYNLAFTEEGGVGRSQARVVRDRDLAAVKETWYGRAADEPGGDLLHLYRPWSDAAFGTYDVDAKVPGERLSLYSPGQTFRQITYRGAHVLFRETWYDLPRVYTRGQRRETTWFRMVSMNGVFPATDQAGTRIAERQAGLIGYAAATWKDAEPGHFGSGAYFGDVGNLVLLRDGQQVGSSAWPFGQFLVEDGAYELRSTMMRFRAETTGEQGALVRTCYRFSTTRPPGEEVAALPFLTVRYDAEVDARNSAAPVTGFPVTLDVRGQVDYDPGSIAKVRAWTATDDQAVWKDDPAAWTEVPVALENGRWVARVDNSAATGKHVSIRVDAVDAHGNGLTQVVSRLYAVR
ncbi:S8 family serine peptidase [Nonomuraea africana]|uniref:Peptidase S8/S53 domain-containing protein n=1 Tax=Nonomuraea africana TaxID=46171 RepID=A0ABR9K5V6_9ACTN|nr:S8 family serine peptidase [Nonomuraea africana]MBE1557399.1 hypothetical protein [Nonomuraea africana]